MQHALKLRAFCACRTLASARSISQITILAERLSSYIELVFPGGGRAGAEGEGPGMLQGTDEITRADEHTDPAHPSTGQPPAPLPSPVPESRQWPPPALSSLPAPSLPPSSAPLSPPAAPPARSETGIRLGGGEARQESGGDREARAAGLVGRRPPRGIGGGDHS